MQNNSIDKCWLQSAEEKQPPQKQNKTYFFGAFPALPWNPLILDAFQSHHLTCCCSGLVANMFDFPVSGQKYFFCKHEQARVQRLLSFHFVGILWDFFPTLFSDLVNFLGGMSSVFGSECALCLQLPGPKTCGTFNHSQKFINTNYSSEVETLFFSSCGQQLQRYN